MRLRYDCNRSENCYNKCSVRTKHKPQMTKYRLNGIKYFIVIMLLTGTGFMLQPVAARAEYSQEEHELFLIAQKAFDDGFYDVAIRYITQFLQTYPQSEKRVQVQLLQGQCYFFKNQYLKAFEIFQQLLAVNEYKDATLFWLGETYFKGSDYNQAKNYYGQLLQVYPNSPYVPQAYYSLAWTFFEQGDYRNAETNFAQLPAKFPDHQLAEEAFFRVGECIYNQGDYEKAIKFFQAYLSKYPQSTRQAQAFFYIAEAYYYQEDYLSAIGFYAKAAEIAYDKKLACMAKVSLGWTYLRLEKYELSQKYFEEAQAIALGNDIQSEDIYLGQASLYSARGDFGKARDFYAKMIELFPNSPRLIEARLGRANAEYTLKNFPEAVTQYQELINLLNTQTNQEEVTEKAYYGLAWTYLKKGDIDSAVKTFESIASRTKSELVKASAMAQIGDAYQDNNHLEKAIAIYDRILRDYPDALVADYAQFRQGIALLKLNKLEAATLSFLSLKTHFPGSKYLVDTEYYLGVTYFKNADWAQCVAHISVYLKNTSPQNEFAAESNYMLALSLFNLQRYSESLSAFQKIQKEFTAEPAITRAAELYIAKCHFQLKQIDEAIKKFNLVINNYPDSEAAQEAIIWLADYYLEKSDLNNAGRYYALFLEKFPGSDKVDLIRYQLGQTYQAQRKLDAAINQYKLISEKAAGEIYGKAKLAIADIFSEQTDADTALKNYQDIAKNSPEFKRDALAKTARIYEANKDYASAIDAYQQALSTPKNSSETPDALLRFSIGDMYEAFHNTEKAVETFLKIPYLYPQETEWVIKSYLRIARIFENEEKWEEAKTTYEKIISYKTAEAKYAAERITWIEENIFRRKTGDSGKKGN